MKYCIRLPEPYGHPSSAMYIAGLRVPLSSSQWLEVLIILSTVDYIQYTIAKVKTLTVASESKARRIQQGHMPSTYSGQIVTLIHGIATIALPVIYVGTLVLNQFHPPNPRMARYALPFEMRDSMCRSMLRVVACGSQELYGQYLWTFGRSVAYHRSMCLIQFTFTSLS